MLNHINISGVFVLDHDEALDFYVNKLGLEVSNDMDLGFMRWLTVRAPGDASRSDRWFQSRIGSEVRGRPL